MGAPSGDSVEVDARSCSVMGLHSARRLLGCIGIFVPTLVFAKVLRDVSYQDLGNAYKHPAHHVMNLLDIHLPDCRNNVKPGLVILVHGGGFVTGKKEDMDSVADWLVARGFAAASINYRMPDQYAAEWGYPFPAARDDVHAAAHWLKSHAESFGANATQIVSMGVSAGATISAYLGVTDDSVAKAAGVVSLAGRMDFTRKPVGSDPRPFYLPNPTDYVEASPISHVSNRSSPFFFVHGFNDQQVEIDHSRRMREHLIGQGVWARLIEKPTDHNGVIDAALRDSAPELGDFLAQHLPSCAL